MSLAVLADHMASKGRGPDSMLIHMSPREVQGLQALAMKHGGSLTINPETGLPEAGFLDKLLPAIIGFALAPLTAGTSLAFLGATPFASAMTVGALQTLRTGDIGKGIQAGLGAYGGAGLQAGLAGAGASALGSEAAGQSYLASAPGALADAGAGLSGDMAYNLTNAGVTDTVAANAAQQAAAERVAAASPFEKISAGFDAAKANPSSLLTKDNFKYAAAAAAPILADQAVTSKLPTTTTKPGMIRPYSFDPYGGTYTAGTPYEAIPTKAADGGLMGMADGGYNPGQLNFAQRSEPVVRMAAGGDYRSLTKDSSADDIASAYKQFTTAGGGDTAANQKAATDYLTNLGIGQDKIGQAYGTYQASPTYTDYTQQNVTDYLTSNKDINIADETKRLNANPLLVNQAISQLASGFLDPTQTVAGSGAQKYYDAYTNRGIDANELYAANLALNPNYSFDGQTGEAGIAALNRAFNVAKQFDTYEYGKDGGTELQKDVNFLKQYDAGNFTGNREQQIEDIARETGLSLNEAARRYDAARASMATKKTTIVGGTGSDVITKGPGSVTSTVLDTNPTTNAPIGTTNPYGNINNPGDLTFNNDGTVTVQPNIPGRPYGGFSGIQEIKDAYTKGGGSLGYTAKAPRTIAEFNQLYNKQTGDSLAAYDYLMGKGGGKYPAKSLASQIAVPYAEYALGKKTVGLKPITKTTGTSTGNFKAPETYFDEKAYLAANPDVEAEMKAGKSNFATAYEHYLRYGKAEGRKFAGDYDSYLAAVEAEKAKTSQQIDAGGTGDDGDGPGPGDGQGPGAGEGGGGAPGDCVDPTVHILLADGGTVRAGDLKIGDMLYTLHDTTFVYGNYPVEYLNILQRPKVEALFDDGQKIIISIAHKFLTADNQWEKISDIEIGTSIRGFEDVTKKLVSITDVGTGPVVEMVVTEAHTYISEGLVSHNKYYGGLVNGKAAGGMTGYAIGGGLGSLGSYSDGGRLLKGPGDGVSDSIPATIGRKQQPARLADGEFVIPARIVSELGNGSTDAGAKKLYAMMDRVQRARGKTTGKNKVADNSRADKYLPA